MRILLGYCMSAKATTSGCTSVPSSAVLSENIRLVGLDLDPNCYMLKTRQSGTPQLIEPFVLTVGGTQQ
jgi:hypothetical protein